MSRRLITVAGLIAQVVFVLSWLAAAAWQEPRYSTVRHTISDMYAVTAPYGGFLVVVFTVCGAATIAVHEPRRMTRGMMTDPLAFRQLALHGAVSVTAIGRSKRRPLTARRPASSRRGS
jgi:hypothetical protein